MRVVVAAAIALLPGCRWVFGIDDTTVAGDPDAQGSADAPIETGRPDAAIDAMFCPPGYAPRTDQSCHRMSNGPKEWPVAEADCETAGAHLVVVDDPAELFALPAIDLWVGLSERTLPGTFLWVTDQAITEDPPWATGEPSAPGGASCVTYRSDGFHDDQCGDNKPYVCEFDGTPADPGNF